MTDMKPRSLRLAAALIGLCIGLAGCNEGLLTSGTASATTTSTPSSTSTSTASSTTTTTSAPVDTQLPVISGTPATSTGGVGQAFSFTPKAGSPNGSSLAFLLMSGPAWLSIDTATGAIAGTPSSIDIGKYPNIRIAVTDGVTTVTGPAFTLTVVADATQPASPPAVTGAMTISGSPITAAVEGVAWSFRPSVTVASAVNALTYRVANAPKWTSFDATTGTLFGTPPAGAVGAYSNIVISVSDGTSEAALPAFALTVTAPRPPVISGTPGKAAQVGAAYSFRPTATDPNGSALVYTVAGKPSWATFDPTTGTLSGTPTSSDAGSSSVITITATDGFGSASLPAFSLTVVAPVSGVATLSWVAPTQRTDGTPLTNLAGFRVYYGTSSGSYPNSVSVTNPNLTSYALDALPAGTYYFVTTAFDATGNESAYSTPVSKTIQ